ncbi:MAG: hypothetical protein SO161_00720 [Treponema sp.]|nr:hypothetical protein [Treponema sp.]
MKSFEFLGWLFASQKTGYPGFRYRSSRFPRFAQSSGRLWRPYYPCHVLQHEPGTDLNLILFFQKKSIKIAVFLFT